MSNQTANPPRRLVVLRQVEGPKWCVVEHMLENGKRQFASRIATSRDYASAAQIAMRAADAKRLPLVIEASGRPPRRFDPARDIPAPQVNASSAFSNVYDRKGGQ